MVDGPFAMINADDFYGRGAFRLIYDALRSVDERERPMRFSMVGYELGKTVTPSGKVCRGVCSAEGGRLLSIQERTYVVLTETGPAYSLDGGHTLIPLAEDSTVSMNFWGFTPAIFDEIERRFPDFLAEGLRENPQAEMLIPNLVGRLLREGLCSVDVMRSSDVWYGMTYREDKPGVVAAISRLTEEGVYPRKLWR